MRQYQGPTGESSRRGGRRGPRKAYTISSESKIVATEKRAVSEDQAKTEMKGLKQLTDLKQ